MPILFSPLKIKNITLKNRIVMSPMCQYSSIDGFSNDWHMVHLGTRAIGGAGLIIFEASAVSPEGRITPSDLGIWKNEHVEGLSKIVSFIHRHGATTGIQLAHAGRKASCSVPRDGGKQLGVSDGGWQTVAPGDIPFKDEDNAPLALNSEGINKVISDFKIAAKRAHAAGFEIVEIHAAHGYLLHEFLSPISNNRSDEYGGSFENRIRLLLQVVDAVKSEWPAENPLFVRISATEWTEGGWTIEDSLSLANILKVKGVDLIDCSSGGNVYNVKIPLTPGYQVPLSQEVRKAGILTGAVGLITTASLAESILQEDKADLVLFARELLRNPYFPLSAAKELGTDISWPVQYLRAK
jgi:2,4-dienoyl-CoA reductase-like NADH-dependent reductase (Old Yellow Enzyme family)